MERWLPLPGPDAWIEYSKEVGSTPDFPEQACRSWRGHGDFSLEGRDEDR